MKKLFFVIVMIAICGLNVAIGQWNTNGNNIYNANYGNVGIGNNAPSTLLYVAKNMTEPTITVRNLGGFGGATYTMIDNASGANWKFKATNAGGFKIRDHANSLDVFVIEPNSSANAIYIKGGGSIGMGTASPESSAALDINSTDKGLLIPRMTQSQIQSISAPDNGLQVFCTTDSKIYIFAATSGLWNEVAYGPINFGPSCGSITVNHVAGNVAPVTKTVTYGTVTNIPGETSKCWITSNLGADHQATAVNDATEASAGWYWQFNRMQGYKHDGATRTPNTAWISSIDENSDWVAANDPCTLELGSGWRLPTSTEWINVVASGNWTDINDPWNSALKIHAAGYLSYYGNGLLLTRGVGGNYSSSTQNSNSYDIILYFYSGFCNTVPDNDKANGMTSRCLRD